MKYVLLALLLLFPNIAYAQKICDLATGAPALATDYIEVSKNCAGSRKLTLAEVRTYMLNSLVTVIDGDKGDIVVSSTGTVWSIDTGVIVNADVNASAAIDATKLANGSVSNTEFQRLDGTAGALYNVGGTDVAVADGGTGASSKLAAVTNLGLRQEYCYAMSDQTTDITTGTAKVTFFFPAAATVNGIRGYTNTAPTGSTIVVDCNEAGTTIMSATKLSIDASEKTSGTAASAAVISDSAIAANAEMTCDIDQVGSTIKGKGLVTCLDVTY